MIPQDNELVTPDRASERTFSLLDSPIKDPEGRVHRIAGIAEDITERKLAEERLKQRETQLAEAQRLAHIGSFEWDPVSGTGTWSDELYRILGLVPQSIEVSRDSLANYLPLAEQEILRPLFEKALREDQAFVCDSRVVRVDGAERALEVRGRRLLPQAGETRTVIGTVQDITENRAAAEALRRSEEQLLQSQKLEAVGRLAGGVAHDFNNLLTVIYGYCDLALRELAEDSSLRQKILEIKKAGDCAGSLTKQLLAFSRRQVLQPQVLNLNAVVGDMAKMLRRLIGEDVSLRTVLDPELGSVKADPGQIEQVVLNLAVNARDAMPNGGQLTIETQNTWLDQSYASVHRPVVAGEYVMIVVSDNGYGMDEETRAQVFEPFFTTKAAGKGTGLGLSTVYGIVKQSGGYIWVYSEVGHGTTIKVYLPHVNQKAEAQKCESQTVASGGTETILLVEDEEVLRRIARSMLESKGYHVLEAASGSVAMEICEQHDRAIHLLLTDVVMPEMNGRVVAQRLLERRPELQVLYMSGYTDDTIVHHGVLDEGTNFLEKPFTLESLASKVRNVLSQKTPVG